MHHEIRLLGRCLLHQSGDVVCKVVERACRACLERDSRDADLRHGGSPFPGGCGLRSSELPFCVEGSKDSRVCGLWL